MFSFSGLNKDQVEALRAQHSIYIVGSGRINVAGITEGNINRLCQALAQVMA
jgi:aspartate/tyrosine/aromatic aminotransferase